MKVLVIGKGGREHALADRLSQSTMVKKIWVAPGNAGIQSAGINCVAVESLEEIEAFCLQERVSLVVIGPEAYILSDLKQRLAEQGIACFAPDQNVAQLESSKLFCKKVLQEAGVATADFQISYSQEHALAQVARHDFATPLVVKADGLAQGKGVWVCESRSQAEQAVTELTAQFGFPLLLEQCLSGQELSAFALCDGRDFVLLGTACDYKRITADLFSANTGGMGAYSPCDFLSPEDEKEIHRVFSRTLNYLADSGQPYQGFLFAGLMKTTAGLFVLEYNVRLGDPETQVLLPRMKTDLCALIVAATTHQLAGQTCELRQEMAVHVVATSAGYPQGPLQLGRPIHWDEPKPETLFFAGVGEKNQSLVNSGGRVLGITSLGANKTDARTKAYQELARISFEGMYYRKDIAE